MDKWKESKTVESESKKNGLYFFTELSVSTSFQSQFLILLFQQAESLHSKIQAWH